MDARVKPARDGSEFRCPWGLRQQPHQISALLPDLLHRALHRRLVRPPAHEPRAVPEPLAAEMVVADLDHESGLERLPFPRAFGGPAARSTRRVAGETRRRDQLYELFRQRLLLRRLDGRREADMVQQAFIVIEA